MMLALLSLLQYYIDTWNPLQLISIKKKLQDNIVDTIVIAMLLQWQTAIMSLHSYLELY